MPTFNVHLINTLSTTVTVEADTYDEAIDAAFDSNDMPGGITIGAFGQASVDDGEWEAVSVSDEGSGDEVWSEYPQDEIAALRARVAELEAIEARAREARDGGISKSSVVIRAAGYILGGGS